MQYDFDEYIDKISDLVRGQINFVTITLFTIRGSAPQVVGAKCLVSERGLECGTIGGGKIEATAIRHAKDCLSQSVSQDCFVAKWNLQTDIGMTCGGEVSLLFEVVRFRNWSIAVFGAGHISQKLVPLLLTLECSVTWLDPREEWLAKLPEQRKLRKVCTSDMPSEVPKQPDGTFFVLITRGHSSDVPILTEILTAAKAPPYVGVIGSKQKASAIRRELLGKGFSDKQARSVYCPIGKPIGANRPEEIAISVVSQLLEVRDQEDLSPS